MEVKVMENSAQVLDNISAGCLDEIIDNRQVELPVSKTEKLSFAACDNAIVIHFGMLIENVSRLFFKAEPFRIPAFDHLVEKHPEKRFQVIRHLMGSSRGVK
jgi:hypothetical protein